MPKSNTGEQMLVWRLTQELGKLNYHGTILEVWEDEVSQFSECSIKLVVLINRCVHEEIKKSCIPCFNVTHLAKKNKTGMFWAQIIDSSYFEITKRFLKLYDSKGLETHAVLLFTLFSAVHFTTE